MKFFLILLLSPRVVEQLWVKALTVFYVFIMIPQRKKIAVLHPRFVEMWGAIKMMIFLYQKLSKDNKVDFFTALYSRNNFKKDLDIPVMEISSKFKIISYFIIAYKIRDYDIVFAWNSPMHFVWVISKILFRAKFKLIWWNHHFPWYYEKKHNTFFVSLKKRFEKFSIDYIDLLVANSLYIKDSLLDIFGQSRQIKILHPVVSDIFIEYNRKKERQKRKITLLTYSRWVTWKNIWVIFKMFDFLKSKYDFNLIIWWEGKQLDKYIEKYSWYKNISFLWKLSQDDIFNYAIQSDIFLFPSLIDSFWMSILEMMFLSLPIVWFNFWWVWEIIKDWKNGFLCNSDLEFLQKTETLIKDTTLRKKMWEESLKIARSNFWENIFNKELEKIFEILN